MANFIVDTASDGSDPADGLISLREAIALANGDADADTITFSATLAGSTITLAGNGLTLIDDVIIDGDIVGGDNLADITIDAAGYSGVFEILSGTATLDALTITGGNSTLGGGVSVSSGATATVTNSNLIGNVAKFGGGISNSGTAFVTNCHIPEGSLAAS
mgnify:FL=1